MSSVDPTQIPALLTDMAYKAAVDRYVSVPNVRQRIFRVETIEGWELGKQYKPVCGPIIPSEIQRGQPAPARTMNEGYLRSHKFRKLAESFHLTEEMLQNPNALAILGPRLRTWAIKAFEGFQVAKEQLCADVFNYGSITAGNTSVFDGAYPGHDDPYPGKIYDNKALFATSGSGHPLYFDTATTKVNHDSNALTTPNLEAARILMASTNAVDETGMKIRIDPSAIVIPVNLRDTASVLLGSTLKPGTAQNDKNTQLGMYDPIEWRYLTDTDGWFMGVPGEGLVNYDSGIPMIFYENVMDGTGNIIIRIISYHGVGVEDWRYWSAHATATS